MSWICRYCGKECKNANSLRNHERLCKSNPNRQDIKSNGKGFAEYNEKLKRGEVTRRPSNQYIKAAELGLEKPSLSEDARIKLSKAAKGRKHTDESKQLISYRMKEIVRTHPESYSASNVNGRTPHFDYHGYRIDGRWELDVCKYLEANNISWIKPDISFEYEWNGSKHRYYPDFYLPDYDRYIEVKGYERDRDRAKYQSIPNLILIKQEQITAIHRGQYNIFDELVP